jgi:hypothetical protein
MPYIFIIAGIVALFIAYFSRSSAKRLATTGESYEGIIFKLGFKENSNFNRSDSSLAILSRRATTNI